MCTYIYIYLNKTESGFVLGCERGAAGSSLTHELQREGHMGLIQIYADARRQGSLRNSLAIRLQNCRRQQQQQQQQPPGTTAGGVPSGIVAVAVHRCLILRWDCYRILYLFALALLGWQPRFVVEKAGCLLALEGVVASTDETS